MKKIKVLSYLFIGLIFTACTNYVDDINDDPNQANDATAANFMQGIILANQFWQTGEANRIAMMWLNQATGADRQYISLQDWNSTPASNFDGPWNLAYTNVIAQSQVMQAKAALNNNPNLVGLGQVLEANSFGALTALFGDIPFDEANKIEEFPNPAYEGQAVVYGKIQDLLDDAIANLEATDVIGIPSGDIVYDGDNSKWVALAHTLKARYYLHIKDYTNALLAAQSGISNADGDMKAIYGTTYLSNFNPFYSFLVYDRSGYMSAADAYAPKILDPNSSDYRGNTKTDETARFNYNYLDFQEIYNSGYELNFLNDFDWGEPDGKFGLNMPLVTYGENLLIIAESEARLNGIAAGITAYNDYRQILSTGYSIGSNNDGFAGFSGPNTVIYDDYLLTDYIAGGIENTDGIDQLNAFYRELYEERYIYFNGHYESFVDIGRSDNIAEIEFKNFNGVPQRFVYPQVEVNANTSTPSPQPGVLDPTPVNQ